MLRKFLLILLLLNLSLALAYDGYAVKKPNWNTPYAPTKKVMAKPNFLFGIYINDNDPNLRQMLKERFNYTSKNTNKYLYLMYLQLFKSDMAYNYKYNDMGAYYYRNPQTGQGSETEDVR